MLQRGVLRCRASRLTIGEMGPRSELRGPGAGPAGLGMVDGAIPTRGSVLSLRFVAGNSEHDDAPLRVLLPHCTEFAHGRPIHLTPGNRRDGWETSNRKAHRPERRRHGQFGVRAGFRALRVWSGRVPCPCCGEGAVSLPLLPVQATAWNALRDLCLVQREHLSVEAGTDSLSTYRSELAKWQFCRVCGCHLFAEHKHNPGVAWYMPATLDGELTPGHLNGSEKHIFVGSKSPLDRITDELPQFEEYAPAEVSATSRKEPGVA